MRQRFDSSMYAIRGSSSVYHLLYDDQNYTLCGFRAEKRASQLPARAALHVVEIVPPNRELCKQCDRMNKRRQAVTDNQDCQSHNRKDSVSKSPDQSTLFFKFPYSNIRQSMP